MSQNKSEEPCFSCKITAVTTLIAIGSYFTYQGKKIRSKPLLFLGAGSICLGIGESFGKSPFRS
ncbi:hypothetical protein HHI36_013068 [Cryptolaemus montrouzieri]|uniref:DUF4536 domain-containing protein n=1 Tax=Cryptolaemus montrouzieri TaxID=559131 RepID=A0ABD2NH52_9CUCU